MRTFEALESRRLLAADVDVLSYRYDLGNTGLNANEILLTPANLATGNFGKAFTTTLDGQVYAEPLFKANVNVTRGSSLGIHNVVVVATQHDSLYAVDANTGAILWKDSFLNVTNPTNLTATTGVSTVGANTTVNDTVNTSDINPEVGVVSTPVIDAATGIIYVAAITKDYRNGSTPVASGTGDRHFVHRLWAINIADGSAAASTVIADTVKNTAIGGTVPTSYNDYQYFAGPIVNGTGNNGIVNGTTITDGWIPSSDPNHPGYDPDAIGQIAFNAVLHMNRPATTLVNGVIYLAYASHGDRGPYYGWLLAYQASNLAPVGAFNAVPTFTGIVGSPSDYTAEAGIWMSGSKLASDGTYVYLTTGNGAFNEANSNFDANGFPLDHNYGDCLLKVGLDPNSTPANQNGNGWGLKVYDYFTPSNQFRLNDIDADLGSGGVVLLPDSAGIPGHPHLLITAGKEGRVYLIDRDNMGKFNLAYPKNNNPADVDPRLYDRVLGEFQTNATNSQTHKMYSAAAYFNGSFYFATSGDPGRRFVVSTFASGSVPPGAVAPPISQMTTGFTAGSRGPTFTISSNGATNGIVWGISVGVTGVTDNLLAWNANNFMTPIYNSNTNITRDSLPGNVSGATGVKFSVPTVANGMVYVGTGGKPPSSNTTGLGTLVGYGLMNQGLGAPTNLSIQAVSPHTVHLSWVRNSGNEAQLVVERSTNGTTWSKLVYLPNGTTSYDDDTVAAGAQYFYRIKAISGPTSGLPSTAGSVTVPNYPRGDVDLDHAVTAADVPAMLQALADFPAFQSANGLSNADFVFLADVNGDQAVNNADLQSLLSLLASGGGSGAEARMDVPPNSDPAPQFSLPSISLSGADAERPSMGAARSLVIAANPNPSASSWIRRLKSVSLIGPVPMHRAISKPSMLDVPAAVESVLSGVHRKRDIDGDVEWLNGGDAFIA